MKYALVAVVLLASVSFADVLYSQPNDRAAQPSFFSDAVPGQFFSQRMADDFTLNADAQITGIRWWGGSQFFQYADLTNMASFTVVLYSSVDGVPAILTPLADETFATFATNPTATGLTLYGNGIQYGHEIALSAPVNVQAGQKYWLSVGATLVAPFADGWVWSGSTVGNLVNATDYFTGGGYTVYDPTFNDLAFEIIGVPEPTTALIGLVLGGLTLRRR